MWVGTGGSSLLLSSPMENVLEPSQLFWKISFWNSLIDRDRQTDISNYLYFPTLLDPSKYLQSQHQE